MTEPLNLAKPDVERLILGVTEESFRLIVETIPGLVAVMTPEGRVEHVNGQVLESGTPAQIRASAAVQQAYLGHEEVAL